MASPSDKTPSAPCAPSWVSDLLAQGFRPYIATSRFLLSALNLKPFGLEPSIFTVEDPAHRPFLEAYLLSNSLGFESPDLKMPHWVMLDCAVMQTAIVGFTKALTDLPEKFLQYYRDDPNIALDQLSLLPVSGQISSPTVGGRNLVGFSLFSLRKGLNSPSGLGLYTKALAFEVYRAASYDCFRAISYYDSPALRIHGRFSSRMEIEQPVVPLHPRRDMAMVYKMKIDIDPFRLNERPPEAEPSFWMKAQDSDRKRYMQAGLVHGKRFFIPAPYCVVRDGDTFLPILEELGIAKGA